MINRLYCLKRCQLYDKYEAFRIHLLYIRDPDYRGYWYKYRIILGKEIAYKRTHSNYSKTMTQIIDT